jgi:DNA primase
VRIRREDVEHVREQSPIDEVIGEHLTLRSAGVGSLKGLCPFHDEKTPSFHVRPAVGLWHCFGCNEGGDVISFVQRLDHLGFAEAVERLAGRLGYELHYEQDDGRAADARREGAGQRQRLLEAHRVATAFFAEQLASSPDGMAGRSFLSERGFDREAAVHFGVGFAPRSGEAALRHLRGRGFTEDELVASGLAGRGQRGLYDRFRGRLVWPIRDVAGDVVGFGARRLFDDDRIEAKYLNTPETAIYKKSQVLYGVDLARKAIARDRQVVVVEGYTDVMACHLAGVATAVATCGTAFADEHIRIVRRLLGDDRSLGQGGQLGGQVVFTFDGDAAGQKAALRAFEDDQRFVAQTYIAVAAGGMDPCELRQARGDEAVRELLASRQPLFQFAIRSSIAQFDLDTAEGRVGALRAAVPLVARIKDASLRPEYARRLAGWLGMEVEPVAAAASRAARTAGRRTRDIGGIVEPARRAPDPRDPVARVERQALQFMLQMPHLVPAQEADALGENAFEVPAYRAVHNAVRAGGGMATAQKMTQQAWAEHVSEEAPAAVRGLVTELAVEPFAADNDDMLVRLARLSVLKLADLDVGRVIGALRSRLQRLAPGEEQQEILAELQAAEQHRHALRNGIDGS